MSGVRAGPVWRRRTGASMDRDQLAAEAELHRLRIQTRGEPLPQEITGGRGGGN